MVMTFDSEQGMFKFIMKLNTTTCMVPPFDTDPLTKMRHLVTTSWILTLSFPKYVKLAKLVMAHIIGSVEDDTCFSILVFMKSKLVSQQAHYPSTSCCEYVCTTILHTTNFFHTWNALSSGE
jgi:hypothetical protein